MTLFYKDPGRGSKKAHNDIVKGSSIGATLKNKYGFTISKKPLYFGEIMLPNIANQYMKTDGIHGLAVHIYCLAVRYEENKKDINYCTIIETHSPEFINSTTLSELYPDDYFKYNNLSTAISNQLDRLYNFDKTLKVSTNAKAPISIPAIITN